MEVVKKVIKFIPFLFTFSIVRKSRCLIHNVEIVSGYQRHSPRSMWLRDRAAQRQKQRRPAWPVRRIWPVWSDAEDRHGGAVVLDQWRRLWTPGPTGRWTIQQWAWTGGRPSKQVGVDPFGSIPSWGGRRNRPDGAAGREPLPQWPDVCDVPHKVSAEGRRQGLSVLIRW